MEHTRQGLIGGGMRAFAEEAHWFEFSELWDIPKEVRDFGEEMATRGLLDLPYAKTIFWCSRRVGGVELALLCERVDRAASIVDQLNGVTSEEAMRNDGALSLRVRLMTEHDDSTSKLFPPFLMSRATGDVAFTKEDAPLAVELMESIKLTSSDEFDYKWWRRPARWVCEISAALLSRDVELVRVGPPERKVQRDIKLGREPVVIYHVLSLKPSLRYEIAQAIAAGAEKRRPPRIHWRRGHFRDISQGARERLIPIPPMIIGSNQGGMVLKDYALKSK